MPRATAGYVPTLVLMAPCNHINLSHCSGSLRPCKQRWQEGQQPWRPCLRLSTFTSPLQLQPDDFSRHLCFRLSWTDQFPAGICGSHAAGLRAHVSSSGEHKAMLWVTDPAETGRTDPPPPPCRAHQASPRLQHVLATGVFLPISARGSVGGRAEWQLLASQAPPRYLQAQQLSASKRESK